jgi:hypothetical protein
VTTTASDPASPATKLDQEIPPGPAPAGGAPRLQLLVPAYIFPAGDGRKEWDRLIEAAAKVKVVVIANPNSGPGAEANADYYAIFSEASRAGVTLVGYVSIDFGKRAQADIEKDIQTWLELYPQIRGFFFDQQPPDAKHVERFLKLRDLAKRKLPDALLITNPGIVCDEAYLAKGVSDVTCVFSNFMGFDRFELPESFRSYDPSRFAAMPHDIPDVKTMRTLVQEAIIKRIGYIYVSDAKQPNPWSRLPSYWKEEVDVVSRLR